MAEQATETVDDASAVTGTGTAGTLVHGAGHMEHNPGRPISWTGTGIVIAGFAFGIPAFIPSMNWVLFWIGTGVAIIGLFILLFARTMQEDWY